MKFSDFNIFTLASWYNWKIVEFLPLKFVDKAYVDLRKIDVKFDLFTSDHEKLLSRVHNRGVKVKREYFHTNIEIVV